MTTKELIESAGHLAEVVIALIAVSPFIHRAIFLIRTAPPRGREELLEDLKFRRRMGLVQGALTDFLNWARRERRERLTWRELAHRNLWCPLGGHHGRTWRQQPPDGTRFEASCDDCRDRRVADTAEEVRDWLGSGRDTARRRPKNLRRRVEPDTARIGEFADKLAEALNQSISPPR